MDYILYFQLNNAEVVKFLTVNSYNKIFVMVIILEITLKIVIKVVYHVFQVNPINAYLVMHLIT
jgi:hypothetical protein